MFLERSNTIIIEVIDVDRCNEEFVEHDSLIENENTNVNYKDVLDVATKLCRTVSNNPKLEKSTYFLLHKWTKKIRIDKNTRVNFVSMPYNCANKDNSQDTIVPISATVTPQNKRKRDNRFISSMEAQRIFGRIKRPKITNMKQRDEFFVSSQNSKQYGCFICGQRGHGRWRCTVFKNYHKFSKYITKK